MAAFGSHHLANTTNAMFDDRVVQPFGVVRRMTVLTRRLIANFGAARQTLVGGTIRIDDELCEKNAREPARLMSEHAATMGAYAVLEMRHAVNKVVAGVNKMPASGIAVALDCTVRPSLVRTG